MQLGKFGRISIVKLCAGSAIVAYVGGAFYPESGAEKAGGILVGAAILWALFIEADW